MSPFGIAQWLAFVLVPFAAFTSWRWSRPVSASLWLVFAAGCAYVALAQDLPTLYRLGKLEPLRWAAIAPGFAGVLELGRRVHCRLTLWHPSYEQARNDGLARGTITPEILGKARAIMRQTRIDLLSLACVASMASDGAALIGYKIGLPWSLQYVQIVVLAGMIGLCVWPEKEATS